MTEKVNIYIMKIKRFNESLENSEIELLKEYFLPLEDMGFNIETTDYKTHYSFICRLYDKYKISNITFFQNVMEEIGGLVDSLKNLKNKETTIHRFEYDNNNLSTGCILQVNIKYSEFDEKFFDTMLDDEDYGWGDILQICNISYPTRDLFKVKAYKQWIEDGIIETDLSKTEKIVHKKHWIDYIFNPLVKEERKTLIKLLSELYEKKNQL